MSNWFWDVLDVAVDKYKKYKPLVDVAGSAGKAYLDYKDAKRRNELEEAAYDDYMTAAADAGEEAKAAIELNLTPMTISGVPKTKADVTDFTAATGLKHGGISGLRKKYAEGMDEFEVEEMDEEVITPEYLMQEEGVNIGPMVSGKYSADEIEAYEQYKYEMEEQRPGMPIMEIDEFLRFFYSAQNKNKKMMADADDFMTEEEMQIPDEEVLAMIGAQQAAQGGVIGLRKGGRVKRNVGGIMDLGGMEKDYRFNGGFVPIGEYEKKDDVPARLSKNEFVFTADAVRAAGGGSINKGAKRMYDTMKNLEARPEAKRMTA